MDTLTKEVAVPLGAYVKGFPPVQRLHPFEQAMLELTWGTQTYEKVLCKVDSLRKSVLEVALPALLLCMNSEQGWAQSRTCCVTHTLAAELCRNPSGC